MDDPSLGLKEKQFVASNIGAAIRAVTIYRNAKDEGDCKPLEDRIRDDIRQGIARVCEAEGWHRDTRRYLPLPMGVGAYSEYLPYRLSEKSPIAMFRVPQDQTAAIQSIIHLRPLVHGKSGKAIINAQRNWGWYLASIFQSRDGWQFKKSEVWHTFWGFWKLPEVLSHGEMENLAAGKGMDAVKAHIAVIFKLLKSPQLDRNVLKW